MISIEYDTKNHLKIELPNDTAWALYVGLREVFYPSKTQMMCSYGEDESITADEMLGGTVENNKQ